MPSAASGKGRKSVKKQGNLFVISAPSGSGKSTLCNMLLKNIDKLKMSVSFTTRSRRKGERNNIDYSYISERKFRGMIQRGEFAEWAMVHGNLYGTSVTQIKELNNRGYDIILDIDVQGARQIKKKISNAIFIFILPPSMSVLRRRLISRRTDSREQVEMRLGIARKEISEYEGYDYIVINKDLDIAYKQLASIIASSRLKTSRFDDSIIKSF
jgi:guanylate kinase